MDMLLCIINYRIITIIIHLAITTTTLVTFKSIFKKPGKYTG